MWVTGEVNKEGGEDPHKAHWANKTCGNVFCSHRHLLTRPRRTYHQGKELFVSTNELFRAFLRVTSSDRGRPRERILLFLAVVQSEEETL